MEILEPDLPIVDPHHHLWDWPRTLLATLPAQDHGFSQMLRERSRYLLDELLADTSSSGHNIIATVYMECGAMYRASGPQTLRCLGETEFVGGIAAMAASGLYGPTQVCAGIVGHVNLCLGADAEPVLESHIAAGHGRFRGIRHSASYDDDANVLGPLHGHAQPGLYLDSKFRQGFGLLDKHGLSFDAWLLEPQLDDLIDLARTFPDTTIVLDHVGTPLGVGRYAGKREERFDVWRQKILTLAKCPNVNVKLGGLAMAFAGFRKEGSTDAVASQWRPYIETCMQAFGAHRCMFESNYPVDSHGASYSGLWNAFKRIASQYSAQEKTALFSGTASRVYKLNLN